MPVNSMCRFNGWSAQHHHSPWSCIGKDGSGTGLLSFSNLAKACSPSLISNSRPLCALSSTSASNCSQTKSTPLTQIPTTLLPLCMIFSATTQKVILFNLKPTNVTLFPRSNSGSRTWRSLTWICSGCAVTLLVYRAESCPTRRACSQLPAAPPKPLWDAWGYSPSPRFMHW